MKRHLKSPLFPALAGLLVVSCATSSFDPRTGEVSAYAPSSSLVSQGSQQFQAMKRQKRISGNSTYRAQVGRVAARLKAVIPMKNSSWEFVVFEDPVPNAFALPGGKVGINTGIFPITKNDAGLAAVLGHEIAHVTLNHSQAKMDNAMAVGIGTMVLDQVLGAQGVPSETRALAGAAGTYGVLLPYSRNAELQADKLGTIYMAKAGYDPEQAVALWRRFSGWKRSKGQSGQPEFASTHPVDETRIRALQEFMPTAKQSYKR